MGLETIIGLTLTAASTVIGGMGAISSMQQASRVAAIQQQSANIAAAAAHQQAVAAATASAYQQRMAENNAALARDAAMKEELRGDEAAMQQDLKNRAMRGTQRAAFAASGVDVNVGSPEDIQESSRVLGRLDTMNVKTDSKQRVAQLMNQEKSFMNEGELLRQQMESQLKGGQYSVDAAALGGQLAQVQAQNAATRAGFSAAGTILSGMQTFASKWYDSSPSRFNYSTGSRNPTNIWAGMY